MGKMGPKTLSVVACALLFSGGTDAAVAAKKNRDCPVEQNIITRDGGRGQANFTVSTLSASCHAARPSG
jgi:hypothetical protein